MTNTDATSGCVFCDAGANAEASLVVYRGTHSFVVLNLFPYNSGHVMVVPNRHIASLAAASPDELTEMITLTRVAEQALNDAYRAQGLNIGMNLGRPAGAGIADHMHIHVVPRWSGDTNFMTVVGDVRVLPEDLAQTAERLRPVFAHYAADPGRVQPVAPSKPGLSA